MKPFDTVGMLATPGMQNAPPTRLPLARRIVLHWVVRLLITWFGFGLLTAATVAGLHMPCDRSASCAGCGGAAESTG